MPIGGGFNRPQKNPPRQVRGRTPASDSSDLLIACGVRSRFIGGGGETEASLDRLGSFLETAPLADVQLTLQTPLPGTALHRRLRAQGRLLADRGWSHYTLFDVTYRPDAMSVEAIESGFRALVGRIFSAGPAGRRAAIRRTVWARHPGLSPCA